MEAALALCTARAALAAMAFVPIRRFVGDPTSPVGDDATVADSADTVACAVRRAIASAACRLPWHSSCLARALAGRMMLRRRGVPCHLVFGVTKKAGTVHAHAWLMANSGVVCGGSEASAYQPIALFRK